MKGEDRMKQTSSSIVFQSRDMSVTDFEHIGQQNLVMVIQQQFS